MIEACPCCGNDEACLLHQRQAQIRLHVRLGMQPGPGDFAPLTIVRCSHCGHIYNRDFDEAVLDRLYGDTPATNIPVHQSMLDRLSSLSDWIGEQHFKGKRVLEVGGGTGHFAFALARKASEVTVYEPCLQLPPPELGITNVRIVTSTFPGHASLDRVDFVTCRQTIEHVATPLALLQAMRAALVPGGTAYFEVPRAEYITENVSLVDLHLQHVHYFNETNFLAFAARAGFAPIKKNLAMEGHDFGYLFRAVAPDENPVLPTPPVPDALAERMRQRISNGRRTLGALAGKVALYGANTMAQAMLSLFGDVCSFETVLDDSQWYLGFALHDRARAIPIQVPSPELMREHSTVVIAAFLHDKIIAGNLRAQGYTGRILTMRPTPLTDTHNGILAAY
jgi:SAM-dependent methyltransferase